MIRYSLLSLYVVGILAYSGKDWFRTLCSLIVLVGVLERPDMPEMMLGITGMNPFNIGLAAIVVSWAVSRFPQKGAWQTPRWFNLMSSLLAGVVLVGFVRLLIEPSNLVPPNPGPGGRYTTTGLVLQFLFDPFKWVIPGLLVFQGARSKEQHQWAVLGLVGLYLILALQTIKHMPLSLLLDGEALEQRAVRVLNRDIGYHRVELAGVFAGASWAMLAARPLFSSRLIRVALLAASGITVLALALTGGRMGYGTWCLVGILMAGLRWRRALILGPIAILILIVFAPGITQRFLQGISYDQSGQTLTGPTDLNTVTAGRSQLWPYVLQSIAERPVFGFGREAFDRNGLRGRVFHATGQDFGHPHNGYFQFALDNGLFGLMVFLTFCVALLLKSVALFRRDDPRATAAGGMAFALLASHLIAAVGAQTFYPTALSIGLWSAIALLLRASVQQSRTQDPSESVAHPVVTHMTKAPRLRWAVARLRGQSIVQPLSPDSPTRRGLARPPHRARPSSAGGQPRMRSGWRPGQRRH